MTKESLKNRTIKGVAWSGIDNLAQFSVSFVVSVILARLLSPDDYGLLGIITIFTTVCNTVIEGGFKDALIRKKDANEDDYNTVLITNVMISIVLYGLIFICAPLIADFFHRVELIPLIRVSTIGMIIGAMGIVQLTRLSKMMDFQTQAKVTFIASIFSGLIGISLAFNGYGVWALVAQLLSIQISRTFLLWFYSKWYPRLRFSQNSFQELFGFGWKMMLSGLLDSAWKQLYQVVVGRFYVPSTLGQYTRAQSFSSLLSSNLTTVIQRVSFPVLSNIRDDNDRMRAAYRKMITTTMFVAAISSFFLGAIAEPLLYCLIGAKWHEAATYLPLICISASTYPLHAINLNMLEVQGRSDLFLGLEFIKKTMALAPLFIGAFIGILPMLYSEIIFTVICFFLNSHYSGKMIGYSSWMQIKDVIPSYILASIVAIIVYLIKFMPLSYWLVLPIQIVIGIVVLLILCKAFKIKEFEELIGILSPYLNKTKR